MASLQAADKQREVLREQWRRNQELCMQAFTTIVYHGSMFGDLRTRWDPGPHPDSQSGRAGSRGIPDPSGSAKPMTASSAIRTPAVRA